MNRYKTIIKHCMIGIIFTACDLIVYFIFCYHGINYLDASTSAWLITLILAYFLKYHQVSTSTESRNIQLFSFFYHRLVILLVEVFSLFILVYFMELPATPAKICITILLVLLDFLIHENRMQPTYE